jgi:MFS superfamily sulfate permease-like transporter
LFVWISWQTLSASRYSSVLKQASGWSSIVEQVPKILGIHFARGTFVHNALATVQNLPGTSLATLAVGAAMIIFLLTMERFLPKVPAPLLAVAVSRRHLIALLVDLYAAHLMSPFPIDIR